MQFILEQEARFASDIQVIKEVIKAQQDQFGTALLGLATAQERTNAIVETLAERHVELAQSHKELADQHKATDQNLNALISTVERHIGGHN